MDGIRIAGQFDPTADVILYEGDCMALLSEIPDSFASLVVTSPPYNLGKPYESRLNLDEYLAQQRAIIGECVRVLNDRGSICWQVGNYVDNGEIIPLDILLYPIFASLGLHLRNRIVWHFGHGLHASKRFSGRYEVILWFTKSDDYVFNLDAVRVPQKYPNKKYFKGPKKGQLSGNPLGKNPSDVWEIPNVKANHVEKTIHPCQFPVELVERLVLAMTNEGDWVLDPFMGVGTTAIAALMHKRRAIGAEIVPEYVEIARERIRMAEDGTLRIRPMTRSVYDPDMPHLSIPPQVVRLSSSPVQPQLFEASAPYTTQEPDE
ncbi:MAG: site-specific DNA-methyltransferase [Anaerolineales bacterium]